MPIILPKSDKTVAYSFRTTPKNMQDLKDYAKAIKTTVPLALNEIIETAFKNKILTRGVNNREQLPVYKLSTKNKDKSVIKNSYRYTIHYNKLYEHVDDLYVHVNNCLDVWKDGTYKSDDLNMKHEGLALLKDPHEDKIHFIKIDEYKNNAMFSYFISKEETLKYIEKAENHDLIGKINNLESYSILTDEITNSLEDLDAWEKEKLKIENKKLKLKIKELESKFER